MFPSIFTVKLSNCEHLKNFRNVDCVLANQYKVQDYYASKPQNHKLITVAVCGLVNSHLIGLFLETQWHSINVSGVHAFVSFTVRVIWNSQNRAGATYFPQLLPTWPPATDIGKQEKNGTKRNPQLFDSLPTCCIYLATWILGDSPGQKLLGQKCSSLMIENTGLWNTAGVSITIEVASMLE